MYRAQADKVRLLITVKAAPAISTKYHEVNCIAGVRLDTPEPEFCRLFPIPFRDLPRAQQFRKYDVVELEADRHSDKRTETLRPNVDSLVVVDRLDTTEGWAARRALLEPLACASMCELRRRQKLDGTSLGLFQPAAITDFVVEPLDDWSSGKAALAAQGSLLAPEKQPLARLPYRFKYRYRCDDRRCNGHEQTIVDWELSECYRKWRYSERAKLDRIRTKWLNELCAPSRETFLFVGNQHQYPDAFLVLGVFWPPKVAALTLTLV